MHAIPLLTHRVYHAGHTAQCALLIAPYTLHPPHASRAETQRAPPATQRAFMNESQRLANQRMKRASRMRLHYPVAADMLATIKYS